MCARYFDHKADCMMKCLQKVNGIFDEYEVIDFIIRTEFQMRGSPHRHKMEVIKFAPKYDPRDHRTEEPCIRIIDRFITCEYDPNNPYIKLQMYMHTHTCYKKKGKNKKCRFGIPHPVLKDTRILTPLGKDEEMG